MVSGAMSALAGCEPGGDRVGRTLGIVFGALSLAFLAVAIIDGAIDLRLLASQVLALLAIAASIADLRSGKAPR